MEPLTWKDLRDILNKQSEDQLSGLVYGDILGNFAQLALLAHDADHGLPQLGDGELYFYPLNMEYCIVVDMEN